MARDKHVPGDIARTAAAAPLTSTIGESLSGTKITEAIANGDAPQALVDAARESNNNATPKNRAIELFGEPDKLYESRALQFRSPARAWSRQQKDGSLKRLIANAALSAPTGISLEFGVFVTTKDDSDAQGAYTTETFTIMLPMNFGLAAEYDGDLEAWKYDVLKQHAAWAEANKATTSTIAVSATGARLIKVVRKPTAVPLQNPAPTAA